LTISSTGRHVVVAGPGVEPHVLDECFGLAWINARCPPKPLYHSPPQLDRGEEI